MSKVEFEFDVAFSFHSLDEGRATQLNDLVQDRFNTFIYSERQEMLAGADGEEVFNSVFGRDARLVVVFYRTEWGETSFTRIEQTAIRNRAFDDGFDFSLFVPTENPPTVPPWLPRTQIWFGLDRYGIEGLAAVVEVRIQEMGGEPRVESIEDRAARFQRAREFEEAKQHFRRSEFGVQEARAAFRRLTSALESKSTEIGEPYSHLKTLKVTKHADVRLVSGLGLWMTVEWKCRYNNSLDESFLRIEIFDGIPCLPGRLAYERAKRLSWKKFEYDLLSVDWRGYVENTSGRRSFSPEDLAEHLLHIYLDAAQKHKHH